MRFIMQLLAKNAGCHIQHCIGFFIANVFRFVCGDRDGIQNRDEGDMLASTLNLIGNRVGNQTSYRPAG